METLNTDISWLALLVGVILSMVLGFLWYNAKSPTGKLWMDGVGLTPESEGPMGLAMAMNTLGIILIGLLVNMTGAAVGYFAAIAFGVMQLAGGLFAQIKPQAMLVHIGYWLGIVTLMVVACAIF